MPRALTAVVLITLAWAGCGDPPDPPPGEPAVPAEPGQPAEPAADRPAVRIDTLMIEGMPEPVELRLVESPDGFPLHFTTYVPADMEPVIQRLPGDRASARFVAAFGGRPEPRAFLEIEVYGTGTTAAEAAADARGYAVERRGMAHRVQAGEHDGRVFRLTLEYPPEFGDGMAPRTAAIIESWRWADGSRLRTGWQSPSSRR